MGMGVGLSGLLLAVPTVLAVLRGGRGRRHRRDDRHRPGRALTGAPPYYYAPGYYAPPYYYGPR